jgi:hypothetical protein
MTDSTTPALARLVAAQAASGQPEATLAAVCHALGAAPGHRLFTVLVHDPAAGLVRRAYSNRPAEYPVGGAKPVTDTDWARRVLRRGEPYLARTMDDIRSVFFDHALIRSLGCESALCLPVRWNGAVLAALNLLHESGRYDAVDPAPLLPLAQCALPAVLALQEA